ncbi:MAG TPA: GtrA family protein [Verrucomicrobiae bacterium]
MAGVITTVIDFTIFNLLVRPKVGWRRIPANTVSVIVAMTWAFLANWFIVFRPEGRDWLERAERFLVTSAFSAFVLQNVILYFTTYVWTGPSRFGVFAVGKLRLNHRLNDDMVSRNICKALAVSAGLIWNFCWYKFFVYAR